jgi:selenocysteine lyase/cysteine desulfurase
VTAPTSTLDVAAARAQLPATREVAYLNFGTEGIVAEPVLQGYLEVLARFERFGYWERNHLAGEPAACRERVAGLVGAAVDEVAITRNGTDGVSMILGSLPWREGDELLIGSEEHPAIVYPAFALQSTRGVRVRRFRFAHDPVATIEAFRNALSPRTRLAAFSHVSCETGLRNPAAELIALAHERGVPVLLDGAQSVGVLAVDFAALGADYLTGSAHKWLCGPKGTGILVVRRDRLDGLAPAYVGGGSLEEGFPWSELERPETVRVRFQPSAARFEYGMRNPALYAGLRLAIEHLDRLGWEAIRAHQRGLTERLKARLAELPGVRTQTPLDWERSSAIVNFGLDGLPGRELSQRLWNEHRIVQRAVREPDGVRISSGYCTADEDHDRLIAALRAISAAG